MFDLDRWEEIWNTISRNRKRSILTAFGVSWGIFMLVIMAGAGLCLERTLNKNVGGFATNSAFFFTDKTSEPYKGFHSGRYWEFRDSDVDVIRRRLPQIKHIAGMAIGDNVNLAHGENKGTYFMLGQTPEYIHIEPRVMMHGRFINQIDMDQRRKVCSIGDHVYKDLFTKGENPIGTRIKVGESYFTIVGVHVPSSDMINVGGSGHRNIIIPITTLQQIYNRGDKFEALAVSSQDDIPITLIEEEIKSILRSRNDIAPNDTKAIMGFNLAEQFAVFQRLFFGIALLTWIVGMGTLLAGVVGVSNIMLVVVRERTQEIGVRRALGAKPSIIISQIISESFVLTFGAGVVGLTLGISVLSIAEKILANINPSISSPQISFWAATIATLVLIMGGILSGILPATRALSVKAVDAIREE